MQATKNARLLFTNKAFEVPSFDGRCKTINMMFLRQSLGLVTGKWQNLIKIYFYQKYTTVLIWCIRWHKIQFVFQALFIPERIADMPDKKVMDIEASEAYLDHQILRMEQQKNRHHDWIHNELK